LRRSCSCRSGRPTRTGAARFAASSPTSAASCSARQPGSGSSSSSNPLHAARVFWDRTFGWQLSRSSPFSIWDWDEYPGYPDLHHVQTGLKVALLLGAIALYFVPRVKNEVQIAALSAALLIGFEAVLTHWFYLYIPWFFPFVAFALLAPALLPACAAETAEPPPELEHEPRALVPTS
jgi:hypothetical protein